MSELSFRVECAMYVDWSARWVVQGRAYADVRVGDALLVRPDADHAFRVEEIQSYGRRTGLLSRMMTGTLILSGGDKDSLLRVGSYIYR